MVFHRLHLENVSLTTMRFRLGLMITLLWSAIFLAPISASANPYLAKPGEAPTPVYAATCATSGGFIHMYTALDQNLFAKYGISVEAAMEKLRPYLKARDLKARAVSPATRDSFTDRSY